MYLMQWSLSYRKGHSLERTSFYKGRKFLTASTVGTCDAPSHQRTPLIRTEFFSIRVLIIEGLLYCQFACFKLS